MTGRGMASYRRTGEPRRATRARRGRRDHSPGLLPLPPPGSVSPGGAVEGDGAVAGVPDAGGASGCRRVGASTGTDRGPVGVGAGVELGPPGVTAGTSGASSSTYT